MLLKRVLILLVAPLLLGNTIAPDPAFPRKEWKELRTSKDRSYVEFRVPYFGTYNLVGRFKDFDAHIAYTKPDFSDAVVTAAIKVKSVIMPDPKMEKELMKEEQRKQFGDTMAEEGLDPYFWCSKLHFYIDEIRFYNFPYTIGFLLSASLFARFKEEGASFLPQYETFLQKSGSMSCEQVVRETIGEDIQNPDFWARAIESLNEPFTKLKALLD